MTVSPFHQTWVFMRDNQALDGSVVKLSANLFPPASGLLRQTRETTPPQGMAGLDQG